MRIAFVLIRPQLWGAFETLVRAAVDDPDVDPVLIIGTDPRGSYQQHDVRTVLAAIGTVAIEVRSEGWMRDHLSELEVAVFHDPYLTAWAEQTGITLADLEHHGIRSVLSPYALALHGARDITDLLFDQPLHHCAWRIYAPSTGEVANYDRFCRTGSANVRSLGYVKQERLLTSPTVATAARALRERVGTTHVTLWNPHFPCADGSFTFATFGPALIERAIAHPDEGFIFRPHPRLFPDLERMGAADAVDQFRYLCGLCPNIVLDESTDAAAALVASDLLVSDLSSLIPEYGVLQRPVILTLPPEGIEINDVEGITIDLARVSTSAELNDLLDDLLGDLLGDLLDASTSALPTPRLTTAPGGSGARIMADLVSSFLAEVRSPGSLAPTA